jgi:hypothetical protein
VTHLSLRADFTARRRNKLPLVVSAEALTLRDRQHVQAQLAWRPRTTLAVTAAARALDGRVVHERVSVRGRFREINSIVAELSHRHRDDWRWDPAVVTRDDQVAASPRPYLELGPVLPRLFAQLRAGTVLFDNIDLVARVATAIDLTDSGAVKSSLSAGYLELGGALEVRLRRTLAVGAAVTTRGTSRLPVEPTVDADGTSPLPPDGSYGERSFLEAGVNARLSLGARTLTFAGELYGRRTRLVPLYLISEGEPALSDIDYLGGRASVDAWIGRRLRLMARYEVVSELPTAPEITGYKSLRILGEATF